jgi:hypothetical protein
VILIAIAFGSFMRAILKTKELVSRSSQVRPIGLRNTECGWTWGYRGWRWPGLGIDEKQLGKPEHIGYPMLSITFATRQNDIYNGEPLQAASHV